jgi:hypothetical protein
MKIQLTTAFAALWSCRENGPATGLPPLVHSRFMRNDGL